MAYDYNEAVFRPGTVHSPAADVDLQLDGAFAGCNNVTPADFAPRRVISPYHLARARSRLVISFGGLSARPQPLAMTALTWPMRHRIEGRERIALDHLYMTKDAATPAWGVLTWTVAFEGATLATGIVADPWTSLVAAFAVTLRGPGLLTLTLGRNAGAPFALVGFDARLHGLARHKAASP